MARPLFRMRYGKICSLPPSSSWQWPDALCTSVRSVLPAARTRRSSRRRRNQTTSFCGCTVCCHNFRLQWRCQLFSLAPLSLLCFFFCCHFFLVKEKRVGAGGQSLF